MGKKQKPQPEPVQESPAETSAAQTVTEQAVKEALQGRDGINRVLSTLAQNCRLAVKPNLEWTWTPTADADLETQMVDIACCGRLFERHAGHEDGTVTMFPIWTGTQWIMRFRTRRPAAKALMRADARFHFMPPVDNYDRI